ncbi:sulfite exporter TauE/SafE family protein [Candidatus Woesearchaeota archaeon]|nr:sulfite exporter TauE/SafE family protein [Candidatus Woesearchaeota archaeon]
MMIPILFWVAAFFSEVIGTVAGFGSSTFLLPIALFWMDFPTALILVAIFHLSGSGWRVLLFHRRIDFAIILRFGIPSIIFTVVGAAIVNYTPQILLKMILGLFLVFYVLLSWKNHFFLQPTMRNNLLGGSLSGFFAGLIGTGGALRGAFLASMRLEKSAYIATAALISLAVDLTRIPIYLASGFLTPDLFYAVPFLVIIALLGSFTGKKIVRYIPQKMFRRIVLVAIGVIGLKFVYEGILFLWR